MFVVVNTDLHVNRLSRNFERVAITFQPRFVFDDLKIGEPKADEARKVIRNRLVNYDRVPVAQNLGSFGDKSNHEWTQYYLDDGEHNPALDTCPVEDFSALSKTSGENSSACPEINLKRVVFDRE